MLLKHFGEAAVAESLQTVRDDKGNKFSLGFEPHAGFNAVLYNFSKSAIIIITIIVIALIFCVVVFSYGEH